MNVRRSFDSWGGFVDAAVAGGKPGDSSHSERDRYWDLGVGWDGAVRLAREGWPDGQAKVREVSGEVLRSVVGQVSGRRRVLDVAGHRCHIGRFLSGDPRCMVSIRRAARSARVVRLVATISASYCVKAEDFVRRGAAVAAVVDVLEASGVRCEVVVGVCVSRGGQGRHMTGVLVKPADQALDIDLLSFALAHPATLRRLWFGFVEGEPEPIREYFRFSSKAGSYGRPETYASEVQDSCAINVLGFESPVWKNDVAMAAWVREQVGAWVALDEAVGVA